MIMVTSFCRFASARSATRGHRILMAGLHAFAARGFENCTIDEIARTAGVGKGTVYN